MATAVAAMAAKARREVEKLFFDNDAFSPDRSVEFDPSMPIQRRYLEQLIGEGVVHQLESGRYGFDLPAYKELKRQRFVWSMRILGFAAVVFVVVLIIRMAVHLR
jgi:hypothetical protein